MLKFLKKICILTVLIVVELSIALAESNSESSDRGNNETKINTNSTIVDGLPSIDNDSWDVEAITSPKLFRKHVNATRPNSNKNCHCGRTSCKCCRKFNLDIVKITGPGCVTVKHLYNEKLLIGINYGNITMAGKMFSTHQPDPVCLSLSDGMSRFCGRLYGLSRPDSTSYKACLGLELRADVEMEASLRITCFIYGSNGLFLAPEEPIKFDVTNTDEKQSDNNDFNDDDDDDENDFFDLSSLSGSEDSEPDDDEPEIENGDDSVGLDFFDSPLLNSLFGGSVKNRFDSSKPNKSSEILVRMPNVNHSDPLIKYTNKIIRYVVNNRRDKKKKPGTVNRTEDEQDESLYDAFETLVSDAFGGGDDMDGLSDTSTDDTNKVNENEIDGDDYYDDFGPSGGHKTKDVSAENKRIDGNKRDEDVGFFQRIITMLFNEDLV